MNTNSNITEEMLQEVTNSNLSDCLKSLLVAAIANATAGSRQCRNRLEAVQTVYAALADADDYKTIQEIAASIDEWTSHQWVKAQMKKLRAAGCEIVQGKPQRSRTYGFHAYINANFSEKALEKLCMYAERNKENDKVYRGVSLKDLLEMCGDECVTFYPNYAKYNTYMLRK